MKSKFSLILFFAILLAISLACQTVGGVGDKIQDAGATAQSAATQVQALATQAMGLATSAVDLATQGAPLVETAQAVAT
ncbi:MAG: hypothetical protein JW726_14560, partial [Anaerolineales bacterium]|nr:hypothetical protein [Anaerolineales bacterium]